MFAETATYLKEALSGWSNVTVLNVGSGTPDFYTTTQPFIDEDVLAPLRERGCWVINLDAKSSDDPTHVQGYAGHMPFATASMDRVLCLSLLEHVVWPETVVSEIRRVLKPDGCAVFECPAEYPHHPDPIDTGLRMRTEADWLALLKDSGFSVTYGFKEIQSPSRGGSCSLIWAAQLVAVNRVYSNRANVNLESLTL